MKAYGGFKEGKLQWHPLNTAFGPEKLPAIFKSKKAAERYFYDVRPINIIESIGHDYKIESVNYKHRKAKE